MARDIDYQNAITELRRANRVAMTCHVKPDADALGSMAALRRWLLTLGKTVEVIVPTAPPPKCVFLDPDGVLKVAGRDVDLRKMPPPDLVCVVDTCTWLQLKGMEPLVGDSGAPVLAIDHHRTQDPLADFSLVDPEAAGAVVIVHRLLVEAGATIDAQTATFLLAGLVADTDWFRLPNVIPDTFRLAADLVEAGASPHEIFEALHQSDELTKMLLLGRALETLHAALDGRVMIMRLSRALFREVGADIGDTENLINECMKVRGGKVGVLLVEADDDEIRLSLRSRPPINVMQVAQRFGGGGHHRAAGARMTGTLDRAEAEVIAALAEILDGSAEHN